MNEMTLTLLLSQRTLPPGWYERLMQGRPRPAQVNLFCLAQATHLLGTDFSSLSPGHRGYCAYSHRLLGAPPPGADSPFAAGNLLTLGGMVRHSHLTLSVPHSHWPVAMGEPGVKKIGILLGDDPDTQRESIRLATGLAGCNHLVNLYSPLEMPELRMLLPETCSLLEALEAMKAEFTLMGTEPPPGTDELLLQL
ncbi:MAG: hypothetical protein H7837_10965 [Magnetococcus sp. MYC-9]